MSKSKYISFEGSQKDQAATPETVHEQLEFEFMAEIQKPEQMESAFGQDENEGSP